MQEKFGKEKMRCIKLIYTEFNHNRQENKLQKLMRYRPTHYKSFSKL
jgi:hypothetical protein